jgi:hypothetical protein
MKNLFKNLLLNINKEEDENDFESLLYHSSNNKLEFEDANNDPMKPDDSASKNILFYSKYSDFTSDTKLNALGGLSMWEFTGIVIASFIMFGNSLFIHKTS